MKNFLLVTTAFVAGIACGLIVAYGPLHAEEATGEGDIMTKLEEISKSQEEIKASINSLKEEIQIIKIRVTQSQ